MTHVTYFASSNARWDVEYARRSFYSVFFVYVYVGKDPRVLSGMFPAFSPTF